jgi:outer membrane protein
MPNIQNLKHLNESINLSSLRLEGFEYYLLKTKSQNIGMKMAALSQDLAKSEIAKYDVISSPKVDVVAQTSRDRLSGSGDYGTSASNTMTNHMVALQLTLPIYTGGYRSAKYEESLNNLEKARADYDRASLDTEKVLRQVWMALDTSKDKIPALIHSKETSQARLNATRNGHKVGSRSTLELLGAEVDAIVSEQNLFFEQTNYLLNRLRLSSIISELGEAELTTVNAYLK